MHRIVWLTPLVLLFSAACSTSTPTPGAPATSTGGTEASSARPSATVPVTSVASPTSVALLGWVYPSDTSTGIGTVDAALRAMANNTSFLSVAKPTQAPCLVNPKPDLLGSPTCSGGMAAGTLVPAYLITACGDE